MENRRTKINRWVAFLMLIVGAGAIYALCPLVTDGIKLLIFLMVQGFPLLLAVPQTVWWLSGAIFLIFWGLRLWLHLVGRIFSPSQCSPHEPSRHGHLRILRQMLDRARSDSSYSQEAIRQRLRLLAIDLIMLKLDCTEEEARNRFFRGDWTPDPVLRAYLYKEREFAPRWFWKRSLRWIRRSGRPTFLQETREAVDLLKGYGGVTDGRK